MSDNTCCYVIAVNFIAPLAMFFINTLKEITLIEQLSQVVRWLVMRVGGRLAVFYNHA